MQLLHLAILHHSSMERNSKRVSHPLSEDATQHHDGPAPPPFES